MWTAELRDGELTMAGQGRRYRLVEALRVLREVTDTGDQNELVTEVAIARRLQRAWFGLQDDLAHLSTDSVHVIALHSTHFVMSAEGQPGLVISAVRAVLSAARSHAQLPVCGDLFASPGALCVPK